MRLMIYGAYGYTGELIAREAVRRGLRPVIAGRNADRLKRLAAELDLDCRAFPVDDARNHLDGIRTILNCAGPFSQTAALLTGACLARGVHYVDVTGEIPALAHCHRLDAEARSAGVILCPGAGFDVVPTDCLAATLKARKPDAVSLNLAFSFGTKPSVGTAKTTIEGLKQGGMIRRDHALVRVPDGYDIRRIPFPLGERWAATVPYGDVYTAGVTTGIPNIMVYSAAPLAAGIAMKLANPLRRLVATPFVQKRLTRLVERVLSGGPDAQARAEQRTEFWGEAVDAGGGRVALGFSAPNVYALTVDTALEIAAHCSAAPTKAGFYTPSMLMGADFVSHRPGVTPMVEA
ncbi:saccharopine dehydrogenase NADP-binding domain-containing protein [Sphingopyxis sp.]|uniref:saccharopine dehydrogenase family protein n=1 Tax=Sphingopyxis sp. TaxID=1908224 RepID=UPI002630F204|nr:saccharopine dehydrogenase NADP-binding domain-containing protein [Sphingopyxis sp.]MCW0200081.1 saccharopine dehydrogenase NADP-binding domain-containing protein [Sphingopyxis sp.]